VHRLEFPFPVNYLCYASCGACFAGRPLDRAVPAAVVVNLLLIVAGLAVNAAVDIRTDARHPERGHLAGAVLRLGRGRIIRLAAGEAGLACLVAARFGRPSTVVLAAVIIALQVLYNTEPVRLKRRGLTGVAAFCAAVLVLPFLLSYLAVRPDVEGFVWPVLAGLGILAVGRMTLWSIPDRPADAATGMATPAVRYGGRGARSISRLAVLTGVLLTGWGLWWRYGPAWAVPVAALQGAVLYGSVGANVSSALRIRRLAMPPAMIGTVALTVTPLLAA
jgi:4-hydroxybenzoate polyprenyltransferase